MKIVKPYMRMLTTGAVQLTEAYRSVVNLTEDPVQFVAWCGNISHRSEAEEKRRSAADFLKAIVIDKGDWSIVEHVCVSVDAVVDRGLTHEIVRHRLAAYTQESTRFVNYEKKIPPAFIYPQVYKGIECEHCLAGNQPREHAGRWIHDISEEMDYAECHYDNDWLEAMDVAEAKYKRLLAKGWQPQDARSVFPTGLASRIVGTLNLRMWRHFFLMRTSAQAHPLLKWVDAPLLAEFKQAIPVLYDDIDPGATQILNLRKGR